MFELKKAFCSKMSKTKRSLENKIKNLLQQDIEERGSGVGTSEVVA